MNTDPLSPENRVRLVVNGTEYDGWKSVRISAGIERQARDFELEVTDRWPGRTDIPRVIRPGDACQVYIGSDLVMTGYVDATPVKYDGKAISVGVKGRSKTADLVDCCPVPAGRRTGGGGGWSEVRGKDGRASRPAVRPPATAANQWRGQKLEVIAAALAAPYGIRVIAEVNTGAAIANHQVQVGETVFESIDRMMRIRHVLSTDNAQGDLVFIEPGSSGTAGTALELGKNILTGSADLDYKAVFSEYIVKGQRAGNDQQFGRDVSEEEGNASDDDESSTGSASSSEKRVLRRRVLVIKQSGQADSGTCRDRAEYEKAYRMAKALETIYSVAGWRQEDGALWRQNLLVTVRDSIIGFDMQMLIAELKWVLDADGMRTEIKVGPPDGYRSKAAKSGKSKKGGAGGGGWREVK